MAKKSRMGVLKRQRELKKQEKAALKRERKAGRKPQETLEASVDDLVGYGVVEEGEDVVVAEEDGS
ncbi:MAG: hypothetical protein JRG76_02215 [Deltaproteobacteria bacterium]|nr:hypothetical protein [Deltaproteobacteria bacterium]MBW2413301.1 hypothetical protein [Deltaproteobacteria bacterium]